MKPLAEFSMRGLLRDMWMHGCVFSAAHYVAGHLVVVMYIHSGGVLHKLQASRVMLLALYCFYIPSPVGHLWPTRADHASIMFKFCCRHVKKYVNIPSEKYFYVHIYVCICVYTYLCKMDEYRSYASLS